jgi:hypothetical protein
MRMVGNARGLPQETGAGVGRYLTMSEYDPSGDVVTSPMTE